MSLIRNGSIGFLRIEDAVKAYTINNVCAGFKENDLCTIEFGKLANLLILNDNIFEIAPKNIIDTHVTHTIIGGEVLYKSKEELNY